MRFLKNFFHKNLRDPELVRRRQSLGRISVFQGLSSGQLTRVLAMLYHRHYQEGETIFKEGDMGRALFIIESGRVVLFKKDKKGGERRLGELKSGDFFGEMALLEERPRSATAAALEPSSLFFLYKSSLDGFTVRRPDIGVVILSALARLLSARLRHLSDKTTADSERNA
ncbi:MAG: cyclic nucleotide-binding domain-containing protein [Elusimicrobia bacterium]|nr:cyclic nucleotide-binding domain-containing protein [Elusimicrobiota bacterium]